jgi:hypothetical protein
MMEVHIDKREIVLTGFGITGEVLMEQASESTVTP